MTGDDNRRDFSVSPCIWTQAGIAGQECHLAHHCSLCSFNKEMVEMADENKELRKKGIVPSGEKGKVIHWKEKMEQLPPWKRPCVHHLRGEIEFRACTGEYRCRECEFNQFFEDEYTVHAFVKPVEMLKMDGIRFPQGYYLHPGHMWVKIEEDWMVRIGLDHFALRLFGKLDAITAPLMGKRVTCGAADIRIDRKDKKAGLISPVSGIVTAVNTKLRESGKSALADPYTDGWVARIHAPTLRDELKHLMMGSETAEFYREETQKLFETIEEEAGPLAADGGSLAGDIYGKLPADSWEKLVERFLRS